MDFHQIAYMNNMMSSELEDTEFLSPDNNRRRLAGEGGSCRNLWDCDGNLQCCQNKICSEFCDRGGKSFVKELGDKCHEHFDCRGQYLCCP